MDYPQVSIPGGACAVGTEQRAIQLVQPMDSDLLTVFEEYGRNVAAKPALRVDRDFASLNTRLSKRTDRGRIEMSGPAPNVGYPS